MFVIGLIYKIVLEPAFLCCYLYIPPYSLHLREGPLISAFAAIVIKLSSFDFIAVGILSEVILGNFGKTVFFEQPRTAFSLKKNNVSIYIYIKTCGPHRHLI